MNDNILTEYSDLRIAEKEIQSIPTLARNYYIHQLPELNSIWWTNRNYRVSSQKVNPYQYTCTCSDHQQRMVHFRRARDVRRVCKHIYWKLINTPGIKEKFDSLSILLLKSTAIHNEMLHFKYEYLNEDYYFGFRPNTNWINVYLKQFDEFRKYGYNPIEHRWSYNSVPENSQYAIYMMERLTEFQLPFTHNWSIQKILNEKR